MPILSPDDYLRVHLLAVRMPASVYPGATDMERQRNCETLKDSCRIYPENSLHHQANYPGSPPGGEGVFIIVIF